MKMLETSESAAARPRRRVLRFRLRTLFVLLTLFCVWLGIKVRDASRQKEAVAAIRRLGGDVRYDYQRSDATPSGYAPAANSWVPEWLLAALGLDLFYSVEFVNMVHSGYGKNLRHNDKVTPEAMPYLVCFPKLRCLYLHETQVTDEGMRYVGRLRRLETLYLWDAEDLTDAGVAQLRGLDRLKRVHINDSGIGDESLRVFGRLPEIEELGLQGNRFTDRGLKHLRDCTRLRELWIGRGWEISDQGLAHLTGLHNLRTLDLQKSRVTVEGLRQLRGLPQLKWLILCGSRADDAGHVQPMFPRCRVEAEQKSTKKPTPVGGFF
jgi:hypothetical protein